MNDELSGKVKEIFLAAIELDSVDHVRRFWPRFARVIQALRRQN